MTDEMHSLLGRYFSGEATAEEQRMIQQWVEADEQNRADFNLLEKLWNKSGEVEPISFDTDKAWQAVNARIRSSTTPVRRMRTFSRAIAVAASIVALFGIWWIFKSTSGDRIVVADVAVKEVKLEDGSTVYLRKGSTLQFPEHFQQNLRDVTLKGEAFFEVAPDAAKPFVISAARARVEVVGTSFSVSTKNDSVELIVKTGRVKFGASGNAVRNLLVIAGERALFAGNDVQKELNRDENFNAWQSGLLVFNNTPLPEVAVALSNYYNVSIRIKPGDAAQLSGAGLTARFDHQELPAVLAEISLITSYRIQRTGDAQYEISIK